MTALASPELPPASTRARRPWLSLLAPFAVGALATLALLATYRVFVRTITGQRVDTIAMLGGDVQHPRVVEILSRTLNGTTLASLVLVCLAAATIGVLRRRVDLAVAAAVLVLGANITTQLLKTELPRPSLDGLPYPNSFPSGHVTAAASVAFALILVLPPAIRATVTLIGAGYTAVIAVATVWAEWHRPSDSIAALLVALAWSALAVLGVRLLRLRTSGPARRPSRLATLPLLLAGAVSGGLGTLGLVSVTMAERVTSTPVSGRFAFISGSLGMTAAVAGAFLVWVWLATEPDREALDDHTTDTVR